MRSLERRIDDLTRIVVALFTADPEDVPEAPPGWHEALIRLRADVGLDKPADAEVEPVTRAIPPEFPS